MDDYLDATPPHILKVCLWIFNGQVRILLGQLDDILSVLGLDNKGTQQRTFPKVSWDTNVYDANCSSS